MSQTRLYAVWGAALGSALVLCFGGCRGVPQEGSARTLTVASFGGAYQNAQRQAFFDEFERKNGIRIVETQTDYGKLREMVRSKKVTVDVADVESFFVGQASADGLLEPIDYSHVPKNEVRSEAIHNDAVGACIWATVLAYDTGQLKKAPRNWAEFWDLNRFPGQRSLRDAPRGTLEIALLASGVPPDSLYPLDLDRAFQSLDKIRAKTVFWTTGDQPRQLLANRQVSMAAAWNVFIHAAQQEGKPLAIQWSNAILDMDWWVIPKGAPHRPWAFEFIGFASQALPQATFSGRIPYAPINTNSIPLIDIATASKLPDYHKEKAQLFINQKYWAENEPALNEKWRQWSGSR